MDKLTKDQKAYLITILEDQIALDTDMDIHDPHPTDALYYINHINKMEDIINILNK